MSAWLKAGLIGGAILFVLSIIIQIPVIACCGWLLTLLAYVGIGALAASYTARPRDTGKAAGQGALAAVVAAFIGGVFNFIFGLLKTAMFSASGELGDMLAQLPPEFRYQLRELGVSPDLLVGVGGVTVCNSICCLTGVIIAAVLGAVGGAIYASMKYGAEDETGYDEYA